MPSYPALDWQRDGRSWPHRAASRFVEAGGLRWHVQRFGAGGEPLLLVHGTGAATHSWRGLAPLLAERFEVLAMDLPGHGFTSTPVAPKLSLPGMADALATLLDTLHARPAVAVGHSAGAAILARMCLDGAIAPRLLVGLNGALLPLRGIAGRTFLPLARLLVMNPLTPRLFARRARSDAFVRRLLDGTGSRLDETGRALYGRLAASPGHAYGALAMMANWDLEPLARDLPALGTPLLLVSAGNDRTIAPAEGARVAALLPDAPHIVLPGLGHLAHEEDPQRVAALILDRVETVRR